MALLKTTGKNFTFDPPKNPIRKDTAEENLSTFTVLKSDDGHKK